MMKRYITQLSVQHNRHTFSNVKSCGDNNNIPQAHNRAVRQASELPEEQNPERIPKESRTTDRDGNITQYTAYLPYGELLVDEHSSSEDMPYKFNGKELDEETGLYYYGARYMQPITSVWYGIDPLTEKYPEISGHVYCHGNPIKYVDVDGKDDFVVNSDGQITKVTNNKTPQITITEPNGESKLFSDHEILSYFFGLGNSYNRKLIANVANYYVNKMNIDCDVFVSGENRPGVVSYYSETDKKIWICSPGINKPDPSLNNKYNLMNTLYHEYNHKLDDEKHLLNNHYLHASVVERASSHWTFAKTDTHYKWGEAFYFSQLAMNAYYRPNKHTKENVINLITKFNNTNKGGIKLQFDPINQKMNITLGSKSIDYQYKASPSMKNTIL